ncbi:hypothetical protein DYQ86_26715 [Acidobacteria bacterium AB60]|nr:hypothetical protein DYQ86_26715 [Acidobacteria bacterium AB60]
MRQFTLGLLLVLTPLLFAQQSMNNDSVIKLCQAGISDDVIVSAINFLPGEYKTSADDLVALKTAGVSDKVVAALVTKGSAPASTALDSASGARSIPSGGPKGKPRVCLSSSSHGNQWNAHRDQAMEMSKDFEKNCPDVKVTITM